MPQQQLGVLWHHSACTYRTEFWPDFHQASQWQAANECTSETSGAALHSLDGMLGLDGGNGSTNIFGNYITEVEKSTSQVFIEEGSYFTNCLAGSKDTLVISTTVSCSQQAFSAETTGAYVAEERALGVMAPGLSGIL